MQLLPNKLVLNFPIADRYLKYTNMEAEPSQLWTTDKQANLSFKVPSGNALGITFIVAAFVDATHPVQRVSVYAEGLKLAEWQCADTWPRARTVYIPAALAGSICGSGLRFELPDARPSADTDDRKFALRILNIGWQPAEDEASFSSIPYGRMVGSEARKSFDLKLFDGFWSKYVTGPNVLDVGFAGYGGQVEAIVPGAIGVDVDYPGYDGTTLPFPDNSQDVIFSSHCLEHIPHYVQVLQDWLRVTRVGGHMILAVPHAHLYERKRRPPSQWNSDHKRFYTPASLLAEIEQALPLNSYRVRHCAENDWQYDYGMPLERHPSGCYEIEIVLQKISSPSWSLPD